MLTIICAGYYDVDAVRHYCGKVIGEKESDGDGETHTYCDSCYTKAVAALDIRQREKRSHE